MGALDGRSRTRWPLTGTSTPCDLTTSTQLASIDMQYDQAPCAFVLHSRFLRRRSNRPRVTGACASLTSSRGSLWRRRAAPPSHAIEQATSRDDDGQPAAQAEHQQSSKAGQLPRPPAAAFGAARRACQREEPAVRCFFGRTKSGSSFLQKIM